MSTTHRAHASVSVESAGSEITFETGKLAKQADGAVVVRSGDTMVLATAQGRLEAREGADFFPLTVDVEERMYAAGKIPGGFFKREGRADRARDPDRAHDRPPDPAALAEGLPQRGAGASAPCSRPTWSSPHDILCINGASAALMISPLPVHRAGRRRAHRPDRRRARRQPDAAEADGASRTLDLIVVGTKDGADDGRGRRRARSPRRRCSRRSSSRTRRSSSSARRRRSSRAQAGKPKWLDVELTAELEAAHGERDLAADRRATACARPARSSRSCVAELCPEITMESTEERHRPPDAGPNASLQALLEQARLAAVEGPVREQFENELRALTDAEQDSKELKSAQARPALRPHRRDRRAAVPGRPGAGRGRGRRQGLADEAVTSRRPPRRSTRTSSARRSRSRSAAPTAAARRRSARSRARSASRRARTARRSSRAGRRRS